MREKYIVNKHKITCLFSYTIFVVNSVRDRMFAGCTRSLTSEGLETLFIFLKPQSFRCGGNFMLSLDNTHWILFLSVGFNSIVIFSCHNLPRLPPHWVNPLHLSIRPLPTCQSVLR